MASVISQSHLFAFRIRSGKIGSNNSNSRIFLGHNHRLHLLSDSTILHSLRESVIICQEFFGRSFPHFPFHLHKTHITVGMAVAKILQLPLILLFQCGGFLIHFFHFFRRRFYLSVIILFSTGIFIKHPSHGTVCLIQFPPFLRYFLSFYPGNGPLLQIEIHRHPLTGFYINGHTLHRQMGAFFIHLYGRITSQRIKLQNGKIGQIQHNTVPTILIHTDLIRFPIQIISQIQFVCMHNPSLYRRLLLGKKSKSTDQ